MYSHKLSTLNTDFVINREDLFFLCCLFYFFNSFCKTHDSEYYIYLKLNNIK